MKILGNRILVSKVEEEKKEGFQAVQVQDSFVYKGKVEQDVYKDFDIDKYIASFPEGVMIPTKEPEIRFKTGDIILFAKYSPDTQEVDYKGQKMKIIKVDDVLAIL